VNARPGRARRPRNDDRPAAAGDARPLPPDRAQALARILALAAVKAIQEEDAAAEIASPKLRGNED